MSRFTTYYNIPISFTNTLSTDFNGIDERIDCGTGSNLRFAYNTDFSISFWIKPRSNATQRFVSTQSITSPFQGYSLFATGGRFGFILVNSFPANYMEVRTNAIFSLNTWYHVTCTWQGSTSYAASNAKIYVDNVDQVLITQNDTLSANITYNGPFQISGFNGANQLGDFRGDELSVYNTLLSSGNVSTLYDGGSPTTPLSLSPVSWWRMGDGDNATTLFDQVASNDGTLVNMNLTNYVADVP